MDSDSASSLNFNSIIQARQKHPKTSRNVVEVLSPLHLGKAINDARAASAGRRLSDSKGDFVIFVAFIFIGLESSVILCRWRNAYSGRLGISLGGAKGG